MDRGRNICPPVPPLTDDDARELLAVPLRRVCSEHGPTRVGLTIGCDEKTVRRARDEQSTLGLDSAANLLALDGTAFDGFLARVGRRSVPIDALCDTDALPAMTGAVHKLVLASNPDSPGGRKVIRRELLDAEQEIRAAFDALGVLLQRIDAERAA